MSERFIRRVVIDGRQHYQVCERVETRPGQARVEVLADLDWHSSLESKIGHLERQALELDWDAASLEERPEMIRLDAETAAGQARDRRGQAAQLRAEAERLRGLL